MNRDVYVATLAQYGVEKGLIEECDRVWAINQLLDALGLHGYEEAEPEAEAAPVEEETLAANEYIGTGVSEIGGELKVKVTMDGDKIAKIEVLSHNETPGVSDPAFSAIPDAIIAANSTDIDSVSGATKTSQALIEAVNDALSQIK